MSSSAFLHTPAWAAFEDSRKLHLLPTDFCWGPTGGSHAQVQFVNPSVQWEELAVTVERDVSQVDDLQPCEAAQVRHVIHVVVVQVQTLQPGTQTSKGP